VARHALFVALAFALLSEPVAAQSLSRLHVRNFALAADRATVREGEPFHLTISAHVDEAVLELDNVTLPDLSGFESLGDERRCTASSRGSDCVEILTLDATQAGRKVLGPVTLDAVDARNGKPSRFATNTVEITVAGQSGMSDQARNLIVAILAIVALGALWWGFGRRTKRPAPAPAVVSAAPPTVPPPAPPDPLARYRELVAALDRDPTRERALAVRAELRAQAGAGREETLEDLVARVRERPAVITALRAIEHPSFCADDHVERAAREALPFLTL
jgi:hypothetical protein